MIPPVSKWGNPFSTLACRSAGTCFAPGVPGVGPLYPNTLHTGSLSSALLKRLLVLNTRKYFLWPTANPDAILLALFFPLVNHCDLRINRLPPNSIASSFPNSLKFVTLKCCTSISIRFRIFLSISSTLWVIRITWKPSFLCSENQWFHSARPFSFQVRESKLLLHSSMNR